MKFTDVLEIKNGRNQRQVENPDGRYPIYGSGGVMGRADDYICEAETVVIGRKGSINNPIFVNEPFWNVDTAFGLIAKRDVLLPKYLYYFCVNFDFEKLNTTVTIPSLTKANLLQIEIALPKLEEQKKVVDVLDKVTNLAELRQQQLAKLDELVKARFVEMFGNPLDGTAKYLIHQVGKVAEAVDPQPSHRTPPIEEDGIPYISIKDCDYKTGVIDFQGARRVSTKVLEEHLQRYTLHDGDFVIGKIGTIGQPIFVPSRKDYALSANIVLIQPDSELVSPYFLKYSFESDFVERQFAEAKNSTSQAAFGIQKVRTIEVMDPDLDVQRTFERFTKQIDKLKLSIMKSLEQMEILKKALMQKYFG